jgi:hypothetical protein
MADIYVCMHVCMYCMCLYVRMCVCERVCVRMCMCIWMHGCMCMYVFVNYLDTAK